MLREGAGGTQKRVPDGGAKDLEPLAAAERTCDRAKPNRGGALTLAILRDETV